MVAGHLNRPEHPDPEVLEQARVRVEDLLGICETESITWTIGRRIDAPRSSVFPLVGLRGSDEQLSAFYKVVHPPNEAVDANGVWESEQRAALIVGPELEERLEVLAVDSGVSLPTTLATDPDRLIHVTKGVPGRPIGRILQNFLMPRPGERALTAVSRVGRAAALIDACSPPDLEIPERLTGEVVVTRRLERVRRSFSSGVFDHLADVMGELELLATRERNPVVYTHGDFNTKNILVTEDRIGLIDFSWLPRLRYSDVAHFSVRLGYDPALPQPWANRLVEALVDGYGDSQLTIQPGWLFLRFSKLLRIIQRGETSSAIRHRRLARRARTEIENFLREIR